MDTFVQHVYELKKGLRRLVLHTAPAADADRILGRLPKERMAHRVAPVARHKINVFFGDADCLAAVSGFPLHDLSRLSDEQDFILVALLGYDRKLQCRRVIRRQRRASPLHAPTGAAQEATACAGI